MNKGSKSTLVIYLNQGDLMFSL